MTDWTVNAACHRRPDLMFGDHATAIAICNTCDHRLQCLEVYLALPREQQRENVAVWAGHTPGDLDRIRRTRPATQRITAADRHDEILTIIDHHGPITVTDLGPHLRLSRNAAGIYLREMTALGLLVRHLEPVPDKGGAHWVYDRSNVEAKRQGHMRSSQHEHQELTAS